MWVVSKGLSKVNPKLAPLGKFIGGLFCLTLLVSTATGGNMFQAWNVGEITEEYFGVPSVFAGIALAVLVGMVIIGGIKRIGAVAGRLVPFMVTLYLLAGLFVLISHAEDIPSMLALIVRSAFVPQEMTGAFIGGTAGYAFLFGMKRALFSNEAGQGTSPIAHSAAKTDEPIREAMVAGLEPFIDTIVVCTFTALVILSTGVWNRAPEGQLNTLPAFTLVDADSWALETVPAPQRINNQWNEQDLVFIIVNADTSTVRQ
jgi:AGCS family alanine or glycine:cation symporter